MYPKNLRARPEGGELHDNFYQAGMQNEEYDLTKIFDGTLVQTRPTDAVTRLGTE
jgi:hypothetical protein